MLRQIWNAYRGWAKLARDMQTSSQGWNIAALCCIIAAAVFGAAASVAPDWWSAWAAGAAGIASALGAFLGRQILGAGDEASWIQARAAAEGIKSECYRYAARCGPCRRGSGQGSCGPDRRDWETSDRQGARAREQSRSSLG